MPDNNLILTATASDVDGALVSVSWSQISGPGTAVFSSSAALQTNVSFPAEDTYIIRCSVLDNDGAVGSNDVEVIVIPPGDNPVPS